MENRSKNPLVSVCVLTYRHQKYIQDCLEGLLNQTYQNMELIIVDDASDDETVAIIKANIPRLQNKFVRFELICHKVNTGCVAKNANEGLRLCRGAYIKEFAGDDVMLPNCIENSVAFLERHPQYDLSYCNMYVIDDDWHIGDRYRSSRLFFTERHRPVRSDQMLLRLLRNGNYIPAPTVMMRKRVYEQYGLYNEDHVLEDYEYWLRIAGRTVFGYLNESLVLYRRAETSLSNIKKNKSKYITMYNWMVRAMNLHLRRLPAKDRETCIHDCYVRTGEICGKNGWYDLLFIIKIRMWRFLIKRKIYDRIF